MPSLYTPCYRRFPESVNHYFHTTVSDFQKHWAAQPGKISYLYTAIWQTSLAKLKLLNEIRQFRGTFSQVRYKCLPICKKHQQTHPLTPDYQGLSELTTKVSFT